MTISWARLFVIDIDKPPSFQCDIRRSGHTIEFHEKLIKAYFRYERKNNNNQIKSLKALSTLFSRYIFSETVIAIDI